MFISIPKDFFVPVVFGEDFIFNVENGNMELETNMYRESTESNNNIFYNKVIATNSEKSLKEKKDEVEEKNKDIKPIYITLKDQFGCEEEFKLFKNLDDEYISQVSGKQCDKE